MKKVLLTAAALAAVAVAFIVITRVSAKQPDASSPGAEVVRVMRRDIGSVVKATGVIKPMVGAEVRVGSSVAGVVSRLFVRIGDKVEKGELLAELDDRELVARRDASEAAVRLANANLSYTRADLRRKQELSTVQVIAPSELDLAQQAYGVAEQQHKQAQANLADSQANLLIPKQCCWSRLKSPEEPAGDGEASPAHEIHRFQSREEGYARNPLIKYSLIRPLP